MPHLALADPLAAGVVALDDDVVEQRKEDLPQDSLPRLGLQNGAVRRDGREQGLAGALPNGGPRVEAEVLQFAVEAHPQLVEGGDVLAARKGQEGFRENLLVARIFLVLKDIIQSNFSKWTNLAVVVV